MQQSRFQQWFKADASQMLVVDGMEKSTCTATASPLTYLAALLTQTLESLPAAVPLTFFCGLHAKPEDNLEGAQGIIRCFVSQLLLQNWEFDCAFIDRNEVERVYTHETSQLCKLFERLLISTLNNMTIFCIIDGISWFENNERCMNVRIVMLSLRQLVDKLQQNSRGVNLKVFVTSPKRSRSADSWSVPGDRLVMPADVGGNGQGSNVLHMTGATQRIMGSQRGNEPEQWAVGAQNAY